MDSRLLYEYPGGCIQGLFMRRMARFTVEMLVDGAPLLIHTNNTGAMLGLTRRHARVLASRATRPGRKLPCTLEAVWVPGFRETRGFWVGVNTSMPNTVLREASARQMLPFAEGYTDLRMEERFMESRLDGHFSGGRSPDLWVECKNVTLVEDCVALFPDARSLRAQKHLMTLMELVRRGQRACMFYLVERTDARCFAPADCIDPQYAELFAAARETGVEMYAYTAEVSEQGVSLGHSLPVRAV